MKRAVPLLLLLRSQTTLVEGARASRPGQRLRGVTWRKALLRR